MVHDNFRSPNFCLNKLKCLLENLVCMSHSTLAVWATRKKPRKKTYLEACHENLKLKDTIDTTGPYSPDQRTNQQKKYLAQNTMPETPLS
jgi:hypothetical protein